MDCRWGRDNWESVEPFARCAKLVVAELRRCGGPEAANSNKQLRRALNQMRAAQDTWDLALQAKEPRPDAAGGKEIRPASACGTSDTVGAGRYAVFGFTVALRRATFHLAAAWMQPRPQQDKGRAQAEQTLQALLRAVGLLAEAVATRSKDAAAYREDLAAVRKGLQLLQADQPSREVVESSVCWIQIGQARLYAQQAAKSLPLMAGH